MGRFIETEILRRMLDTPKGMMRSEITYPDDLFGVFRFPSFEPHDMETIINRLPDIRTIYIREFVGENFSPKGIALIDSHEVTTTDSMTYIVYCKDALAEHKFNISESVRMSDAYRLSLCPGINKHIDIFMNKDTNIVIYSDCCKGVYETEGYIHVTRDTGLTRIRFTFSIKDAIDDSVDVMHCDLLVTERDIFVNKSYITPAGKKSVHKPIVDIEQFVEYVTGYNNKTVRYSSLLTFNGYPKPPLNSIRVIKP